MGKIIKTFNDGSYLMYAEGKFDNWCVYYINSNGDKLAPKDKDYFDKLKSISSIYGATRVYDDFVKIYDKTGNQIEDFVLNYITEIAMFYNENALEIDKIFTNYMRQWYLKKIKQIPN